MQVSRAKRGGSISGVLACHLRAGSAFITAISDLNLSRQGSLRWSNRRRTIGTVFAPVVQAWRTLGNRYRERI